MAKDDIEQLSPSKVSLMPDNAVAQLTFDQFIDLLAFLKSRAEQESLRGTVADYAVGGPTAADLEAPPEVLADASGKAGGPWHATPAGSNGLADLKDAFPAKPAGVFARVWVFAPKPQHAAAALTAESPVRLWLNCAAGVRAVAGQGGPAGRAVRPGPARRLERRADQADERRPVAAAGPAADGRGPSNGGEAGGEVTGKPILGEPSPVRCRVAITVERLGPFSVGVRHAKLPGNLRGSA